MSNTSCRSGEREDAEVREVRVAAALHRRSPERGRRGEVGRHDRRRAAVERERRDEHAPVADRDEPGRPALRLALEDLHRIAATGRRVVRRVGGTRHCGAGGASARCSLRNGSGLVHAGRIRRARSARSRPERRAAAATTAFFAAAIGFIPSIRRMRLRACGYGLNPSATSASAPPRSGRAARARSSAMPCRRGQLRRGHGREGAMRQRARGLAPDLGPRGLLRPLAVDVLALRAGEAAACAAVLHATTDVQTATGLVFLAFGRLEERGRGARAEAALTQLDASRGGCGRRCRRPRSA